MHEWRPIDTAPTDGTRILLTNGDLVAIGAWSDEWGTLEWSNEAEPQPTDGPGAIHGYWRRDPDRWMPLPPM